VLCLAGNGSLIGDHMEILQMNQSLSMAVQVSSSLLTLYAPVGIINFSRDTIGSASGN